MFREIMGLPVHALVVHAAVVFVPLQAAFAIAYGVLPRFRDKVRWVAVALLVAAPAAAWVAEESGEEFEQVLKAKNYSAEILSRVAEHGEYAETLTVVTFLLAVA
ncbi:MAG TPA: hypothetical protein VGD43_02530, partial [Micromonospora sp.]